MTERDDQGGGEVLRSLPARRPQRRSARRDAKAPTPPAKVVGAADDAFPKTPAGARRAQASGKPQTKRGGAAKKAAASRAGGKRAASGGSRPKAVRPSAATRAASSTPDERPAAPPEGVELIGTAVQAAGELAQFGLTVGVKALRAAVKRLPRP